MSTIADLSIKIGIDMADVRRGVSEVGSAVQSGLSRAGDAAIDLGNRMQDAGRSMSATGASLTRNVTAPLGLVGAASFKAAADFESSTTAMVALAGVPREQIEAWEPAIRSAAAEFGKSGAEAADALFFIVSAGLEGDAAMEALQASLKASATGLGTVEEVATLAVKAVAGYGEGVISASEATDILGAAASAAVFPPQEMAAALTNVIPLGAEMGISFDNLAGVMAILSTSTNSASEASTRMTAVMRAVLAPSQQAQKIFDDVGISADELRKVMGEDMVAGIQMLDQALEGDTEQMARVLGSSEALQGALGILGRDAGEVASIMDTTAGAAGFVDGAFQEVSNTGAFQLQQSMAEAKDLLLEVGQTVLPIVTDALRQGAEFVRGLAERWRSLSPETQKFIVQAAMVAAAVGPMLIILGKAITVLGSLVKAFGLVIKIFGVLTKVLLANPWFLVAAAIIALVVVVVKNWDKIKAVITKAWDAIKRATAAVWNWIKNAVKTAAAFLVKIFMNFTLPGLIIKHWNKIKSVTSSVWNAITSFIKAIPGKVVGFFQSLPGRVANIFRKIPGLIRRAIPNPAMMLFNIGKKIIGGLIDGVKNMMGKLGEAVGGIGDFIKKLKGPLPKDRKLLIPEGMAIMDSLMTGLAGRLPELRRLVSGISDQVRTDVDARVSTRVSAPSSHNVLEIRGDGSARASFIIEELRAAIRARGGGDVQAVLGGGRR